MTMTTLPLRTCRPVLTLLALSLTPLAALAHPGGDAGSHHDLTAGLLHTLTGPDHLSVMLAVGLWSGGPTRDRRLPPWAVPAAFAGLLALGALLAAAGGWPAAALGAVESMIAASLLILGLLLATRRGLPAPAALLLAGGFALVHGAAHGLELSGGPALLGMALASTSLLALGTGLGLTAARLPRRWQALPRLAGAALALGGGALLWT
jgi:urease accessory protein